MGKWWPREFWWSQDRLEEIGIEAHEGGSAYERGPHGFTWQIARDRTPQPDPDRPAEVEVVFTGSAEDGTDVALEHRGWERHGEGAREYRDGFEASGTWPRAPESFAAAARSGPKDRSAPTVSSAVASFTPIRGQSDQSESIVPRRLWA